MNQRPVWPGRTLVAAIAVAALFYSADLAAWHTAIHLTKLGNATLLGNFASFAFVAWGLWLARRLPTKMQAAALTLAALGCLMLVASSAELSLRNVRGDLLALAAGILYAGYLIFVERARTQLQPLQVLVVVTLFGALMLLPTSLLLGETIVPTNWTPLLILAVSSQVVGQGLLVYAIGTLPPLIVGLALLTQPSIAALIGWLFYDETLSSLDWGGTVAIAVALVMVQLPQGLRGREERSR
jgi:drug/metabolite transporter (DMT)-like permease